tara:strand:- start:151 stop:1161 length:1011 start_codon:yes stop_codon:yes gene_type:complete
MRIKELSIYPNTSGWAISETHAYMISILKKLGVKVKSKKFDITTKYRYLNMRYQMNISRQFLLPVTPWQKYYFDYFHGGIYGEKEYMKNIRSIYKTQKRIQGIRVISSIYKRLLIENGIDPKLIFNIPLSVDTNIYSPMTEYQKLAIRKDLNISPKSHLIGSFQKDGSGWERGLKPKLIKGPDIFCNVVKILKKEIDDLIIILTGPSRGYIKEKLKDFDLEFRHLNADDIHYRSQLYNILDGYLITSREEGGPNSFLEAMACGIPVVSTNVGHTSDIGESGKDCLIIDSFDPVKLADGYLNITLKKNRLLKKIIRNKSLFYSHGKDFDLWKEFFCI